MKIEWGEIGKCNRCGKPATTWFKKIAFLSICKRFFCQHCLLEVLREQRVEKTKVELVR